MFAEVRLHSGTGYSTVTILPNCYALTFDATYADVGTISFSIPLSDATNAGLGANSVVEVCPNGMPNLPNMYYGIDSFQSSQTSDGTFIATCAGKSLINWMNDCIVYPSTWPEVPTVLPDGSVATVIQGHSFQDATPGNIIRTLVARGVERGGLLWLDVSSFSGETTTDGNAWASTLTTTYTNGTPLLTVLQDLSSRRLIEYQMIGTKLNIYNYGTMPVHYTADQVLFRRGVNITEQTRTLDASDISSVVLIVGDESALTESSASNNSVAQTAIGRRRERFVSQGGITDLPTLLLLANAELAISGHVQTEDTLGVTDTAPVLPWVNYNIGDWVWADFDGTLQNIQIQQIAATQQDSGDLQIGVVLGDLIKDQDEKNQTLIDNITGAGGMYGALPNQNDYKAPGIPTNVVATQEAYKDGNGIAGVTVILTWIEPDTNTDGTSMSDLDHFEVRYKVGDATAWTTAATVPADEDSITIPALPVGKAFTSQVRAVDSKGNASPWANQSNEIDFLEPYTESLSKPSTPEVLPIIQGLSISWNGLDTLGNPYDKSFAQINIYIDTTAGFTPSPNNLFMSMTTHGGTLSASGLDYNTAYYVKFEAFDKSGNYSPASDAGGPVNPSQVGSGDVIGVGGVNVYTQAAQPTGANQGDMWINTGAGNQLLVYDGANWDLYSFGSQAITANSIDATRIVTAGLTASIIATGTLSAATITMGANGFINIGSPGANGIQISQAGLTAWNAGTQTLSVSSVGNVVVRGAISASSIDSSSYKSTGDNTSARVEIATTVKKNRVTFIAPSSFSVSQSGYIAADDTSTGFLTIVGPGQISSTNVAHIDFSPVGMLQLYSPYTELYIETPGVQMYTTAGLTVGTGAPNTGTITAYGAVNASGGITAGTAIVATGAVSAGTTVSSGSSVQASSYVQAGSYVQAHDAISSTNGPVVANTYLQAGTIVTAAGNITSTGGSINGSCFFSTAPSANNQRLAMNNANTYGFGSNAGANRASIICNNSVALYIDNAGATYPQSALRFKKNVETKELSATLADRFRFVKYELKSEETNTPYYGVIADELAEDAELNLFVGRDENGEVDAVVYDRLALATALSVNNKLNETIRQLNLRLEKLEGK